ncbi:MAG: hypothetical protein WC175_04220 [Candidatus Dojkabacteria bacterium]
MSNEKDIYEKIISRDQRILDMCRDINRCVATSLYADLLDYINDFEKDTHKEEMVRFIFDLDEYLSSMDVGRVNNVLDITHIGDYISDNYSLELNRDIAYLTVLFRDCVIGVGMYRSILIQAMKSLDKIYYGNKHETAST